MKKGTKKPKRDARRAAIEEIDWQAQRAFEEATAWLEQLSEAPHVQGAVDLYSDNPYAAALRLSGNLFVKTLRCLAISGCGDAVPDLVRITCELTEALEEIAESRPEILRKFSGRRANWPVMLCRHETTNKLVSALLDNIGLGNECLINASGQHVAKYSLRTPINRYVWRKLKGLKLSISLLEDDPKIAAINLASLPKFTKSAAKIWADKALMPYIDRMYRDFHEVPEFKSILRRPGVRTRGQQRREIRKDVIRALQALAPPA